MVSRFEGGSLVGSYTGREAGALEISLAQDQKTLTFTMQGPEGKNTVTAVRK